MKRERDQDIKKGDIGEALKFFMENNYPHLVAPPPPPSSIPPDFGGHGFPFGGIGYPPSFIQPLPQNHFFHYPPDTTQPQPPSHYNQQLQEPSVNNNNNQYTQVVEDQGHKKEDQPSSFTTQSVRNDHFQQQDEEVKVDQGEKEKLSSMCPDNEDSCEVKPRPPRIRRVIDPISSLGLQKSKVVESFNDITTPIPQVEQQMQQEEQVLLQHPFGLQFILTSIHETDFENEKKHDDVPKQDTDKPDTIRIEEIIEEDDVDDTQEVPKKEDDDESKKEKEGGHEDDHDDDEKDDHVKEEDKDAHLSISAVEEN